MEHAELPELVPAAAAGVVCPACGAVGGPTDELDEAHERLNVLVRQLPAAVGVVDTSGRMTMVNRQAQDLIEGAGLDPASPKSWLDLSFVKPGGIPLDAAERPLRRALEHGEASSPEGVELQMVDGSVRSLEISAAPLRAQDGRITGAVFIAMDVTERQQGERAEREFVSNAAHQLRNPLAAIRSAIEVLQAGAKDDPLARDRFLEHIERESGRLAQLARTLLVLARAESTVEEPRREIVEVDQLLHEVVSRMHVPKGVIVEVQCAPGTGAVGSSDLLEEALACLADNAVRHAGSDRVLIIGRSEGDSLLLEVRDEGRGIPEEVQQRMFERFYQGGGGAGFGLGLAIASQAARATGAHLEIDSQPGRGTTARLTLPAAQILTP